jgi:hypothetical protein
MALSPSHFIATAGAMFGHDPDEAERRAVAQRCVRGTGRTGARRWSAAFVHHVGHWSQYDHRGGRSAWPLPATTACDELAQFAKQKDVLSDQAPEPGELMLLWSPSRKLFVHTGIVIAVEPAERHATGVKQYECHTIEANVSATGRLDGNRMGRVSRFLSPALGDRTIRWTDLEPRPGPTRQRVEAALRLHEQRRRQWERGYGDELQQSAATIEPNASKRIIQ